MSPFAWTDENTRTAVRLYRKGLTAAAIMIEISAPSRDAVCGKLTRLKVMRDGVKRIARPATPKKPRPPRQAASVTPPVVETRPPKTIAVPNRKSLSTAPAPRPVSVGTGFARPPFEWLADSPLSPAAGAVAALTPGCCKFPLGDPRSAGFKFCGAPALATIDEHVRPYCAEHDRLCHSPSSAGFKPRIGESHAPR